MSIYTKAGDTGRASTMTRLNIPKNSPVFELLGTLDECTSAMGVAKGKCPPSMAEMLEELQGNIIALSGEIAGGTKFATLTRVTNMENAIDALMQDTQEFSGFILPGASESGAALDVARTVARRAERCAVAASQTGGISRDILAFLNRLSDLLYALARACDRTGTTSGSSSQAMTPMALTNNGFCEQADSLCRVVRLRAREQGLRVVVAVCDGGGHLVSLQRDDDAYIASIDVATGKAYTAVALKMPTTQVSDLAQPGAPLYGVQFTNGGKIVIFGGGAPLVRGSTIIGGLGVSGGTTEQDAALCEYGVSFFVKEM